MPAQVSRAAKQAAVATRFGRWIELCERRLLLSNYALSYTNLDGANGAYASALTADSKGNFYGTTYGGGPAGSHGTVFEIGRGSSAITTLASFNGTIDGGGPEATVTLDSAGNMYGTTDWGGANNCGTVFELARGSSHVTTLVSFTVASGTRVTPLTFDSAGNLYGTTTSSPALGGHGELFEIARGSTSLTVLAAFDGTNGNGCISPLIIDPAGNLYGTTPGGGAHDDGAVFEVAAGSNTISDIASFNGTNGSYPMGSLAVDSAGNMYGATHDDGAYGWGTVFELPHGSDAITALASFKPATPWGDVGQPYGGVTMDLAGNLYGSADVGGEFGDGGVFEIARGSNSLTTLALFDSKNGYRSITAVTLDAVGDIYGTTLGGGAYNLGTIFELKPNTAVTLLPTGSNPAHFRQPLTFTVLVSGGVPDGEIVTLLDATNQNTVVASGVLVNGSAMLTITGNPLSVGKHMLIAVYGGDANHAASESMPFEQTILFRPTRQP